MRIMRTALWSGVVGALILVAACLTSSRQATAEGSWMPLSRGAVWTYAVTGNPQTTRAAVRAEAPSKGGLWTLKWDGTPAQARLTDNGLQILEQRHVGVAGIPAMISKADLHFSGPATWKMNTTSGCMVYDVQCTRDGAETVTVPAGRYECTKFTIDGGGTKETYYVARGVGIVKYVMTYPRTTIVWTLQAYKPGQS